MKNTTYVVLCVFVVFSILLVYDGVQRLIETWVEDGATYNYGYDEVGNPQRRDDHFLRCSPTRSSTGR